MVELPFPHVLAAAVLAMSGIGSAGAVEAPPPYVQIAQIEIEPGLIDQYKAAVREQIEAAIRLEPGVLTLYAVSDADKPERITVFEIYASTDAYQSHLKSPHFLKYKTGTLRMVKSLRLIPASPIMLGGKGK
jgi:quinol monooxygenase YgiN